MLNYKRLKLLNLILRFENMLNEYIDQDISDKTLKIIKDNISSIVKQLRK